jgi:hypothetical protein
MIIGSFQIILRASAGETKMRTKYSGYDLTQNYFRDNSSSYFLTYPRPNRRNEQFTKPNNSIFPNADATKYVPDFKRALKDLRTGAFVNPTLD